MTWEKTRETWEDWEGVLHSKAATRFDGHEAVYLTRSGKEYKFTNGNKVNALKEISTRIDEIDEQLSKNPPDDVKQLLTTFRQYLVEIDSDFFNVAKTGYNIGSPSHVVPTLTTLYVSNYNMINQLVNQIQELYKRLETNDKAPVVGSAYKYAMSAIQKPPSGGRTRINKRQKINRKSRKNPKRRLT
jgi:hypothetical protein